MARNTLAEIADQGAANIAAAQARKAEVSLANKAIHKFGGEDAVIEFIASGGTISALCKLVGVGNTTFDDLIAPAGRLMSTTPVQHRSRALLQAGARTAGLAGAGTLAAGAGPMAIPLAALTGISLAGQTGRGARFLMGGTAAQKKMAKILQDLGPAAQALYTGTATTNSEGEE